MAKSLFKKLFTSIKNDSLTEAASDIDALIRRYPSKPNNYIKKGDICQKIGNTADAVAAYHRAADIYTEQGFLKTALAIYKLILRVDPGNSTAFKNSEQMLSELQEQDKASIIPIPTKRAPAHEGSRADTADIISPPVHEAPVQQEKRAGKKDEVVIRYVKEISKHTFLSAFSGRELESIVQKADVRNFSPGEAIVREGDTGDSVFIVREGTAEVVFTILDVNILLATLKPGDIFGEIAFLTGSDRTASVIAKENMIVLELDRPLIEEMVELKPEILEHMNDTYHSRAKKTEKRKSQSQDEKFLKGLKNLKR